MLHPLIMPAAASMESLLLGLERDVLADKLGAVTGVAVSLAAACTAISMIGIGAKFLRGKQFFWWQGRFQDRRPASPPPASPRSSDA